MSDEEAEKLSPEAYLARQKKRGNMGIGPEYQAIQA